MLSMVKKGKVKAGFTVEAALVCPFLCLILCGMIQFTLQLYQRVDAYAATLLQLQEQGLTSNQLIRLEAVTEEIL
ncbi:MAG: pilus assembly protein [Lachnospiraceae bacterium]|nr:pilus assembly protein [Lachnospiraceae bacterium]